MPLFGLSKSDVEKMEAKRDVTGLVKALAYRKDTDVRRAAAEALGNMVDKLAVDGLVVALKDQDSDVRRLAAVALEKIGDARAVDGLVDALKDQDASVRWVTAHALWKIGDYRAVDGLVAALKDPSDEVRKGAAEALKELEKKTGSNGNRPSSTVAGSPVIDLRSEEEQAVAGRARSTLEMDDEEIAQKLAQLSKLSDIQYATDKAAYEETVAEFRRIGEQLCANGGDKRMMRIAYRVQALGGRSRDCEMYWEGICGWMA